MVFTVHSFKNLKYMIYVHSTCKYAQGVARSTGMCKQAQQTHAVTHRNRHTSTRTLDREGSRRPTDSSIQ
jgi:hypothetical protein